MKKIFLVHGLKRSGNHGVINWLAAQDDFIFINNAIPIAPILRGTAVIPPPESFTSWLGSRPESAGYLGHSLIVSLEDHDLGVRPFRGTPCDIINIVILRKPSNLFASRIRKATGFEDHPAYPNSQGPAMDRVVRLWKDHAKEFLGMTEQLKNRIGIYFDEWFSSCHYRQRLSGKLGLEFSDRGFARVSGKGGGSSFDGTCFDGDNRAMDVLDRARFLTGEDQLLLKRLLEDKEMQELTRQIDASLKIHH